MLLDEAFLSIRRYFIIPEIVRQRAKSGTQTKKKSVAHCFDQPNNKHKGTMNLLETLLKPEWSFLEEAESLAHFSLLSLCEATPFRHFEGIDEVISFKVYLEI